MQYRHQNISIEAKYAKLFNILLPVQSVPIITKVVSSNPTHGEVYSIQHYVIKVGQ
jgi:hypothetical protein